RKKVDWRLVIIGVILQTLTGILLTKVKGISTLFEYLSNIFVSIIDFGQAGISFLFGNLALAQFEDKFGFVFAIRVLPTIIFFASLTSGLYYLGILQRVVYVIAFLMEKTMRVSGPEALCAAGNIFLGQTEAPLLIKPYLSKMTRSQLFLVMTAGMATIAGGVMAAFVEFLGGGSRQMREMVAAQLVSSSVMNAIAAVFVAKILLPEEKKNDAAQSLKYSKEKMGSNLIDAFALGAGDGLKLAVMIGAMLLAFISLINLSNYLLQDKIGAFLGLNAWIAEYTAGKFQGLSLQFILGQIFQPIAFLIGVDWNDTLVFASLLGEKTVINELVAFKSLSEIPSGMISAKTRVMCTSALCGFANFSSIAIQVGGIGTLAPEQRPQISKLGLYAVLGGNISSLLTATLMGIFYSF
ncbi:MAG: NupC/NupG family nucleoside CNT transporter, partial [Bacteroidia bacterium]|nr:NupC/NupG family nucleoside CNT transporter [Bacteroidia bacterium]